MALSLIVNLVNNTAAGAAGVKRGLDGIRKTARDTYGGFAAGIAPEFAGKRFEENISRLEGRMNRARGRLTGAIAQGIALFAPAKFAADFDQAFRGVRKVLNDVPEDKIESLRKFILETSTQIPVSAANLSELMASAIQYGIPIDQIERFTMFVAKGAVAFEMAAGDIGRTMAKLANVYKLDQDGIEDLGDATNHLANNMAANASQIFDFTNRAAAAANIFKMTAVEMAGIGTAMISAGIQPEVAARGMNAMSNNILAGGKKVDQGFKKLGINRKQFLKRMKDDGATAFMELMEAAAKSEKGMEALINIVGKDFADDFGKLINAMQLFADQQKLLNDDRSGSVDKEFKDLADGANMQWRQMVNTLQVAAITIGAELLPTMLKFADTIGWAAKEFAAFADANPELVSWLVHGVAAMLAFGIASRLVAFAWAGATLGLFRFLGLFFRFNQAGKNVAVMARLIRGLGWAFTAIKPLRWALLIPKLAWRTFLSPLRWLAFLTPLRWAALVPKLSWRLLIPVLRWGARIIPMIGWAVLAGELAWNLLIKPLGWDKYLNLDKLKEGLDKAKNWLRELMGITREQDPSQNPDEWTNTKRGYRRKPLAVEKTPEERAHDRSRRRTRHKVKPIYDPAKAGTGGDKIQQKIDATIAAKVIDKRPPKVTVNAPITINEASDAGAVAAAVRGQLGAAVSQGKAGALHDGVD